MKIKKIILISCVSKKLSYKANAKDLYISPLFKLNLQYAQSLRPDAIFILSAKYGLVGLKEKISPYNKTLNSMKLNEILQWSDKVLNKLSQKVNMEKDHIIFLAGERYRKYLIPNIKNYEIPMEGLSIGKQLQYLKNNIKSNG